MSPLRLRHLTFVGGDKEPASVQFGRGLTVIYGASDTGKSFIVDAIDYMLGRRSLRQLPEAEGYTHALLGIDVGEGQLATLVRPVTGGAFSLYLTDITEVPQSKADRRLSVKHNKNNDRNVSRYLLKETGLDEVVLRTNRQNATRTLSFRDIAPLFLIDETSMQSTASPVLPTGQYVSATVERSLFRYLLDNQDDSGLSEEPDERDKRKVSIGNANLLGDLIAGSQNSLRSTENRDELRERKDRISASIEEESGSIGELVAARDRLAAQRTAISRELAASEQRAGEVADLRGRFSLLRDQYDSDLSRLEMVDEAGSLLGFFSSGPCAFCGAEPEHQHALEHLTEETTFLAEAIRVETEKTTVLRNELIDTIEDLEDQRAEVAQDIGGIRARAAALDLQIETVDEQLQPVRAQLQELFRAASDIDHDLALFDHMDRLYDALQVAEEALEPSTNLLAPDYPSDRSLADLCQRIADLLSAWQVPRVGDVAFDRAADDIYLNGQPRASRGKGVRAITHAAFTLALANFRYSMGAGYPGVVVLDSPVVTYRSPDIGASVDEAEPMPESVADSFYRYLQDSFDGQAVVVENVDPPAGLRDATVVHRFTKSSTGRYGFFPV